MRPPRHDTRARTVDREGPRAVAGTVPRVVAWRTERERGTAVVVSNIKPTGAGATGAIDPLGDATPAAPTQAAAPAGTAAATTAVGNPSEAVLSALREGRVTPDEAVRQLTDLALQKAGVPDAMRPQIEARLRDLLGHDPTLGGLLRRMGASVPEE